MLAKRFSNPYIKDTLQRLAEDGSQKLVTTMRDAALENAEAGRSVKGFAVVAATFARYLVGTDEGGEAIAISDPRKDELTALAREMFGTPTGALPVR
jgi:mannitol-1-phosphate/altronate dehydrogenase